jgi:hypothetical protein
MTVRLEAGADTVQWGYLDAALAPASGSSPDGGAFL